MESKFSSQDYNSGNGMMTSVWGPSLWHSLHTISFNYPVNPSEEDKKHYYSFIKSISSILPCKYCRDNFKENIKKPNLRLNKCVFKNRETLSKWMYNFHEQVNKNLGKESKLSYSDIRDRYEHFRARCGSDSKKSKEKGCTVPLNSKKTKCILKIVPKSRRCKSFSYDTKCKKSTS